MYVSFSSAFCVQWPWPLTSELNTDVGTGDPSFLAMGPILIVPPTFQVGAQCSVAQNRCPAIPKWMPNYWEIRPGKWPITWVSEWGLTSHSTHYRSFRRRSPNDHLHRYGQQKLTAKLIKPTQNTQNTIIYDLHTHAHKVILTNKRRTHAHSNCTNTSLLWAPHTPSGQETGGPILHPRTHGGAQHMIWYWRWWSCHVCTCTIHCGPILTQWRIFSPKFGIFGRKFSHQKKKTFSDGLKFVPLLYCHESYDATGT